jgi:hypothetical protein
MSKRQVVADDEVFRAAAERLKESVRQGRTFETAQVRVIGLASIRRAAGEKWPQIAARVRYNSRLFLDGCLGEGDIVLPAGDGFLVIYAQAAGRDLAHEAASLQGALDAFYLGEEEMAALRAQVTPKVIESRELIALMAQGEAAPRDDVDQIVFLPVWNALREAVSAYWAVPVMHTGGRPYCYDRSWLETGVSGEDDFLETDIAILRCVVAKSESALEGGRRCLVGYSVHATTMKNRERRVAYLKRLHETPDRIRPYLWGRIAEVEPGTPRGALAEWVHQIKSVTPRTALELHPHEAGLAGLKETGASCVTCILSDAQMAAADIARCKRLIARWTEILRRQRLEFALGNVIESGLLTFAAASGINYLSGARFWPVVDSPAGIRTFSLASLRRGSAKPSH